MVFNQRTVNPSFLSSRGKCFAKGPPRSLEYHIALECSKSIELSVRGIKVRSAKWRSLRWDGLIVRPQSLKLLVACVRSPVCANIVFETGVCTDKGNNLLTGYSRGRQKVKWVYLIFLYSENTVPSSSQLPGKFQKVRSTRGSNEGKYYAPETVGTRTILSSSMRLWGSSWRKTPSIRGIQANTRDFCNIVNTTDDEWKGRDGPGDPKR